VVPEVRVPAWNVEGHMLFYLRLEKVDACLDWRVAFTVAQNDEAALYSDFDEAASIARDAWERVVRHVEEAWKRHLV